MNIEKAHCGDRVLTFAEAAPRLGCKRSSLHKLARGYGLKKFTFPGSTRARGFLESDIDKLLASRKEA